jgi:hypothetical protein
VDFRVSTEVLKQIGKQNPGAKALNFAPFTARLKSCPDTKQEVSADCKACPDKKRSFSAICYQESLGGSAREMKQRCYYVRLMYDCLRSSWHTGASKWCIAGLGDNQIQGIRG